MPNSISNVFTALTDDAKTGLLGLVTQAHNNIKANPTKETVAAQWALLTLSAPTLIPALQTDAINAINDALLSVANNALSPAATSAPTSVPTA